MSFLRGEKEGDRIAKEFAKSFYNSKAWKKCRQSYIAKRIEVDGGLCEECGKESGYIVHHTIILTPENINNPDIALNHDYLKFDCKACHDREEEHFVKSVEPLCVFDEEGQPTGRR